MSRCNRKTHPGWLFGDNRDCPVSKLLSTFVSHHTQLHLCVMVETVNQDGGTSLGSLWRHNTRVWNSLPPGEQKAVTEILRRIAEEEIEDDATD